MSDVEGRAGDSSATVMNRRALLRVGGVVAGIAGIGGYAAAQAPSAGAAAGDPMVIGGNNQAGTQTTVLVNNEHQPTLLLVNEGRGAPLRLEERSSLDPHESDSGDLFNFEGDLRFAHDEGMASSVYTSYNATQLFPVTPFRAVDTRTGAGRAHILNRDGNLDTAGRLIGGHTIEIDLANFIHHGTAVHANVTVTQPVAGGYLTVWPDGTTRPH
jgi:hypothetical protein